MASPENVEYGDPRVVLPNEILRSVVGSGVHGIAIPGTDDHDEMGVYIEPPDYVLGLAAHRDDYIWRTQPEGSRSGHGDTDLVIYSLRKYVALAVKGNPTVLLPLFAPRESLIIVTPLGEELRSMRDVFVSQQAVVRILGYMDSQHERMLGQVSGGTPNRPELIEKYGWDVKYGSHALRLALQGRELAQFGRLTLPMHSEERLSVLAVKSGQVSRDEVSTRINEVRTEITTILEQGRTPLPTSPNLDRITDWVISAHRRHWAW